MGESGHMYIYMAETLCYSPESLSIVYKTEGGFVLATLSKSQLSVIFLFFNINLFQLEVNYFTILYWFCHTST